LILWFLRKCQDSPRFWLRQGANPKLSAFSPTGGASASPRQKADNSLGPDFRISGVDEGSPRQTAFCPNGRPQCFSSRRSVGGHSKGASRQENGKGKTAHDQKPQGGREGQQASLGPSTVSLSGTMDWWEESRACRRPLNGVRAGRVVSSTGQPDNLDNSLFAKIARKQGLTIGKNCGIYAT